MIFSIRINLPLFLLFMFTSFLAFADGNQVSQHHQTIKYKLSENPSQVQDAISKIKAQVGDHGAVITFLGNAIADYEDKASVQKIIETELISSGCIGFDFEGKLERKDKKCTIVGGCTKGISLAFEVASQFGISTNLILPNNEAGHEDVKKVEGELKRKIADTIFFMDHTDPRGVNDDEANSWGGVRPEGNGIYPVTEVLLKAGGKLCMVGGGSVGMQEMLTALSLGLNVNYYFARMSPEGKKIISDQKKFHLLSKGNNEEKFEKLFCANDSTFAEENERGAEGGAEEGGVEKKPFDWILQIVNETKDFETVTALGYVSSLLFKMVTNDKNKERSKMILNNLKVMDLEQDLEKDQIENRVRLYAISENSKEDYLEKLVGFLEKELEFSRKRSLRIVKGALDEEKEAIRTLKVWIAKVKSSKSKSEGCHNLLTETEEDAVKRSIGTILSGFEKLKRSSSPSPDCGSGGLSFIL